MSVAHKGKKLSDVHKKNIGKSLLGNKNGLGYKHTPERIEKIRQASLRSPARYYWLGKFGEQAPNWKGNKCKKRQQRNDSAYVQWVNRVRRRDKGLCRLKDKNCSGYNIIHHIKGWSKYPELRYKLNNGITLCQAHHPRMRAEEKRLIPFFQGLVSASSELIWTLVTQ